MLDERAFTVIYPDLLGRGTVAGFGDELRAAFPNADLVVVISGTSCFEGPPTTPGLTVIEAPLGLDSALRTGMRRVLGTSRPVVRLDTAEHPLSAVPLLLDALAAGADLAVGDLEFDATTLLPGTADELHNAYVVPTLTGWVTSGRLRLSGAHGLLAFHPGQLPALLKETELLLDVAAARAGRALSWAFDSAAVLAADALGLSARRVPVPAVQLRDRPSSRCADQLNDLLAVIGALRVLRAHFDHVSGQLHGTASWGAPRACEADDPDLCPHLDCPLSPVPHSHRPSAA